jgi:hypothetical protein
MHRGIIRIRIHQTSIRKTSLIMTMTRSLCMRRYVDNNFRDLIGFVVEGVIRISRESSIFSSCNVTVPSRLRCNKSTMKGPFLFRLGQAQVKVAEDCSGDFTELKFGQVLSRTDVVAQTKGNEISFQLFGSVWRNKPAFRIEFLGIRPETFLVSMDDIGIDAKYSL